MEIVARKKLVWTNACFDNFGKEFTRTLGQALGPQDKQAGSRISFCPECPGVSAFSPISWLPACLNHKGWHSLAREWGCSGSVLEPRRDEGNHRWPPGGRDESLLTSCHYHWKSNLSSDSQWGSLAGRPRAWTHSGQKARRHRPGLWVDFSLWTSAFVPQLLTVVGRMGPHGSIRLQALPSGLAWLPTLGLEDGQPNCSVLRNIEKLTTHNSTGIER